MRVSYRIGNTDGLHSSLAVKIVQTASKYNVDINLFYKDKVVDIKSILGVMSLMIPQGEDVYIEANGDNAAEAIEDIVCVLRKH